jgi:membrane protein YqaA with SNARE-associated domain
VTWGAVLAWLTSVAFGVVSAIVPVVNAEVYVLVSQVSAVAGAVPVAVGVGLGQTISGVRRGKQFQFVREHRARARTRERGRFAQAMHGALQFLLRLVGTKRWGLPITLLAAIVGFPPLYAVALLAGATDMKLRYFASVVLIGRVTRFLLVAYGVNLLPAWA